MKNSHISLIGVCCVIIQSQRHGNEIIIFFLIHNTVQESVIAVLVPLPTYLSRLATASKTGIHVFEEILLRKSIAI